MRTVKDREQIVVAPRVGKQEVRELLLLDPAGGQSTLKLGRPVRDCQDMKADPAGNLYLHADLHQVYKFDPDGKFLAVLGGGTSLRTTDGSELYGSIAVDSRGRVHASTSGNPGMVCRFEPDGKTIVQRPGRFKPLEGWGQQTHLAIDRNDQLWAAVPGKTPANTKNHYRPCILRLEADFFHPDNPGVITRSTQSLGLHLAIENPLPYGIAYNLAPVSFTLIVKASQRNVRNLNVHWVVHDLFKKPAAQGDIALQLKDGEEARRSVTFTPPRFGWYTIAFEARQGADTLMTVGQHVGVTPKFPGLVELQPGESRGGPTDPRARPLPA